MLPLLISLGALTLARAAPTNNRPIIGILANGPNCTSLNPPYSFHDAYIAASYVKWVESQGARVVPIPWFIDPAALDRLMPFLNGFVLPGGGVPFFTPDGSALSPYGRVTKQIFDHVVTSFESGESVPLWGTCLGHEVMLLHASGDDAAIITSHVVENVSLPINFTAAAATSRMWGTAPPDVINTLSTTASTINLHQKGVSPSDFAANPLLSSRLSILSTNVDGQGLEFVSSTEGKNSLPLFSTQWHSEKNSFEFSLGVAINHSYEAVVANTWTARMLVLAARENMRAFPSVDVESRALIYNFPPVYSGNNTNPNYELLYLFDAATYVPPV